MSSVECRMLNDQCSIHLIHYYWHCWIISSLCQFCFFFEHSTFYILRTKVNTGIWKLTTARDDERKEKKGERLKFEPILHFPFYNIKCSYSSKNRNGKIWVSNSIKEHGNFSTLSSFISLSYILHCDGCTMYKYSWSWNWSWSWKYKWKSVSGRQLNMEYGISYNMAI